MREARLTLSTWCKDPVASTENIIDTSILGGDFFWARSVLAKGKVTRPFPFRGTTCRASGEICFWGGVGSETN